MLAFKNPSATWFPGFHLTFPALPLFPGTISFSHAAPVTVLGPCLTQLWALLISKLSSLCPVHPGEDRRPFKTAGLLWLLFFAAADVQSGGVVLLWVFFLSYIWSLNDLGDGQMLPCLYPSRKLCLGGNLAHNLRLLPRTLQSRRFQIAQALSLSRFLPPHLL